jgi:hypothetical protein
VIAHNVIAFSISYQRDNLLARGMGLEHLRELLIRLARPMVRQGASLAYGGNWRESEDNFTFDLLRLISAEQEDSTLAGADAIPLGRLYNHLAWPYYLDVTPRIEAQWINCCRIVRVSQQQAGFQGTEVVPDADAGPTAQEPRTIFNTAVALSAMRRGMMHEGSIPIPDATVAEPIPPVVARVVLGGSVDRYSGFVPGIFEEALVTLEQPRPLYILGGFGGAAEVLADAILAPSSARPERLTIAWHREHAAGVARLLDCGLALPDEARSTEALLDALFALVQAARGNLSGTLRTGLTDDETRELLRTRDIATAVRLVRTGLTNSRKLPLLPA